MYQKIVQPARSLGFDYFYLGPVLSNGFALSWTPALRSSNYQLYLAEMAEHAAAAAIHWRDAYQITPDLMALFNEPLSGNVELAGGSVGEIVDLVKACGARLRKEGFANIKFVVPSEETEQASLNDAVAILNDPTARQYVGAIGYHPYPYGSTYASVPNILATSGSGAPNPAMVTVRNSLRNLGAQYGIPVFMTEVSHSEVPFDSFDNLRGRAIHIHDELEYADAAAYFGMNALWDSVTHAAHYQGRADPGFYSETDTVVLIDTTTSQAVISPMGRAIGHYARWLTRGAVRLETTVNDPLVLVSAFRDEAKGRFVLVAINNAPAARVLDVAVAGLPLAGSVSGEQSTAGAAWRPLASFSSGAAGFQAALPALSVTSLSAPLASQKSPPAKPRNLQLR